MAKVAIITDSACSIPHDMQRQYDIGIVPLAFTFGETSYVDNVSLSSQQFYALLKSARRLPTTTSPPPGAFLEAFRQAYHRGCREVLCIVTSSQLTATYSAACEGASLAREQIADLKIRVIDSRSAAASLGFMVLAAARAAADGASLEEAADKAVAVFPRLYMLGVLDTLEYLAKGGRVPQVAAWLFALLQVKHIFQLHDGHISRLGAVRTKPRAVARLLALARHRLEPEKPLRVAVLHAQAAAEAEALADSLRDEFRPAELFVVEFGQVMSIHTGPGLIGLSFYNEL
ncbi:MAG: DegV family protein [Dehalococcoidia bacterium]